MGAAEWVFAAYLGAARTVNAPLTISQPTAATTITFTSVEYRGQSFTAPLYYGYRVAYFPRPTSWIGVEGEFIHLKVYARTDRGIRADGMLDGQRVSGVVPMRSVVDRFAMSHGLNLVLINVAARRKLGSRADDTGNVELIGRLGIGPTVPHAETTVGGRPRDGYELGAIALQAAAGVEMRIWERLSVLAEYKFTRTRQTISVDRGEARGLFASHHAVFGVAWHLK
jgi:opacity protein-like surface antigen